MKTLRGLPALTLHVAGQPLSPRLARGLLAVRVEQRLGLPTQCELRFAAAADELLSAFSVGAALSVTVDDALLFSGELTALELTRGPAPRAELRVRGYDLLHRLRRRTTPRAFHDVSLRELADALLTGLGRDVSAQVREDRELPRWALLLQTHEHDLALLARSAERSGVYFFLHGDTLQLLALDQPTDAVALSLGDALLEATVELNLDPACAGVAARGWELGDASTVMADRTAARVDALPEPPDYTVRLPRCTAGTSAQAEAAAGFELARRAALARVLRGVATGDARLRPGVQVETSGLGGAFDGAYLLTRVCHVCDTEQGFTSELDSTPPPARSDAPPVAHVLGLVSAVDDPRALGRVRVRLPAFDDLETDWLQVLSPAAGANKGLRMLPDVGDRVLVALTHDDAARAVVLGGLHGEDGSADPGVVDGAVRRFSVLSPSGHLLQLDDEHETLTVRDARGSILELGKERVRISARTDLVLEAPGHGVVIRGKTVDFEQA